MQYASGYSLDLYCDNPTAHSFNSTAAQSYFGETFSECATEARKDGWKIHRETRTATCPFCVRTLRPVTRARRT